MKSSITSILRATSAFLIALVALAGTAFAQQDLYVTSITGYGPAGVVNEYSTTGTSGTPVAVPLVSGLQVPFRLAISGGTLYVANQGNGSSVGTITAYNANNGKPVTSFTTITGLNKPTGLAVSGNTLYVSTFTTTGTVLAFNANTGAPAPAPWTNITTGLVRPTGLAVAGSTLYVAQFGPAPGKGSVTAYNANTGIPVAASVFTPIANLGMPTGVVATGNTLYVSDQLNGTVGRYNATTGLPVPFPLPNGTNLISGLDSPAGLVIVNRGTSLFVANGMSVNGTVSKCDANAGTVLFPNFITGLTAPAGIAAKNQ